MWKAKLLLIVFIVCRATPAQVSDKPARPGVKEVQVPFASLKPAVTFQLGGSPDWLVVTDDAVWVSNAKLKALQRIDPTSNQVVANVSLPAEPCSGLAFGFGSVWAPVCGNPGSLARVDAATNKVAAILSIQPADSEGGITTSNDSVWIVTDKKGTLNRIDPVTNAVRLRISVAHGSYNPLFSDGAIWITGFESNLLTAVDASTGEPLASIPVGPKPRFLTSGAGSVWTLNQGDGTVTRVDAKIKRVTATINVGIPGQGGEICYGADSVWATVFDVPLTRIDAKTNNVLRQWVGRGGDSVRFGHDSIWLTDYYSGLLWRIPYKEAQVR